MATASPPSARRRRYLHGPAASLDLQPSGPFHQVQPLQLCVHDNWTATRGPLVLHFCGSEPEPADDADDDFVLCIPPTRDHPRARYVLLSHDEQPPTPEPEREPDRHLSPPFAAAAVAPQRCRKRRRSYETENEDVYGHKRPGDGVHADGDTQETGRPKRRRITARDGQQGQAQGHRAAFAPNYIVRLGLVPLYAHPDYDDYTDPLPRQRHAPHDGHDGHAHDAQHRHQLCQCHYVVCIVARCLDAALSRLWCLVLLLAPPLPRLPRLPTPTSPWAYIGVHPTTRTAAVVVVVLFSVSVVILGVLVVVFAVSRLSAGVPVVRHLDLFDRLRTLDLLRASIPRVVLLGDARFDLQDVQDLGPLHDILTRLAPAFHPPPSPQPLAEHHFTLNAAGQYVPEPFFMHDLDVVVDRLCLDLSTIADHGPLSFRFVSDTSTQFRWSTSGSTFVGPHADLPTLVWSVRSSVAAESVVPGFPPGDAPSPTARPETPWDVRNLDPPLASLCQRTAALLSEVTQLQRLVEAALLISWTSGAATYARQRMNGLVRLRQAQMDELYGGSDRARLASMRSRAQTQGDWVRDGGGVPLNTTGRLCDASSFLAGLKCAARTGPSPRATAESCHEPDARGVPKSFVAAWESYMAHRGASNTSPAPTETPLASPETEAEPACSSADCWDATQAANATAHGLLHLVADSLHPIGLAPDDDRVAANRLSPEQLIARYASTLASLDSLLPDLDDRVSQVTASPSLAQRGLANDDIIQPAVRESAARVHEAAPFLHDVALPRLRQMAARTDAAVRLLRSAETIQEGLRQDIETRPWWTLTASLGSQAEQHVFPPLPDIFADVMLMEN